MEKEKFFDADFRKYPKGAHCAYCQKTLDTSRFKYFAYLRLDGPPTIFNPRFRDYIKEREAELYPIGNECAKKWKKWLLELRDVNIEGGE